MTYKRSSIRKASCISIVIAENGVCVACSCRLSKVTEQTTGAEEAIMMLTVGAIAKRVSRACLAYSSGALPERLSCPGRVESRGASKLILRRSLSSLFSLCSRCCCHQLVEHFAHQRKPSLLSLVVFSKHESPDFLPLCASRPLSADGWTFSSNGCG